MKPPHTTKKHGKDEKKRKDLNPKLTCRICNRSHLRYGSKTNICARCIRPLPHPVKTYGTTDLPKIMQGFTSAMIDRCGLELGAKLMAVDVPTLGAIARGEIKLTLKAASPSDPIKAAVAALGPEGPPEVLARMTAHYKEFKPLDPALARLVAPWRRLVEAEVSREEPGPRQQRLNRAKARTDLIRFVPRVDASVDPWAARNAYGRAAKIGRPRATMAMRPCLGIWGAGLGSPKIADISKGTRWPTSKTSVARMIKQAKQPFPGAVAVKVSDLVLDMWTRPLPGAVAALDDSKD